MANCKSLVFWHGILGIWDIDHSGSGYFGVFTLNFWDLGNCKPLVFWHGILRIWDIDQWFWVFWGFYIEFLGFGKLQIFGLLTWGIWDIDHSGSGYFGVFTLNFWDLGNCKSLVFWHVQDNFIKQLFCVSRAIKRVLHWFYRFCFIFTVNLIGRSK